jgi:SAM-dependent methyltransferase
MARSFGRSLYPLWRLRNSIECADYDERAFRSRIWFQRSWQRWRYHALVEMVRDYPRVLDVGCGSSQVLDGLPQADGCDIRINKLRHKRGRSGGLVRASVFDLPFRSDAYDAVIFSQVIEHLPQDPRILKEVVRVARPGGIVVVGTPDYGTWWTTIEKIYGAVHPGGYADEHITHYTWATLRAEVESLGCTYIDHTYVYGAELIMRFRKEGSPST